MTTQPGSGYYSRYVRGAKVAFMAACASLMLVSCDEIQGPFRETPVDPIGDGGKLRNILIEDFTGQKCGNCPAATDMAKQLTDTYGADRVITIAIHSGQFAIPDSFSGFPVDYRTDVGNAITSSFKIYANPMGMINRSKGSSSYGIELGKWSSLVSQMLKDTAQVDLTLRKTYDSVSRTLTIDADVEYITAGTSQLQIVGMLTESNIIGDQLDYRRGDGAASHIEGYVFNHVLRASMNGTYGEQLSTEDVPKGTKISKRLTYTIPANANWKPENMDAVVYVHRHTTDSKLVREVLQVEHVHVK